MNCTVVRPTGERQAFGPRCARWWRRELVQPSHEVTEGECRHGHAARPWPRRRLAVGLWPSCYGQATGIVVPPS